MRLTSKVFFIFFLGIFCTPRHPLPQIPLETLILDEHIASAAQKCSEELVKREASSMGKEEMGFLLERAGVRDAFTMSSFMVIPSSSQPDDKWSASFKDDAVKRGFTHYGQGSAVGAGKRYACLIFTKREIVMDDFPLQVKPGEVVTLSGRALEGIRPSEIFLLPPSGAMTETAVEVKEGEQTFTASLRIPNEKGSMILEVVVEDEWGPRPAILTHIFAGIPPPSSPRPAKLHTSILPTSVREAEEEALRLINRDRRAYGLPSLKEMIDLSRMARGHSEKMRDIGRLAHIIPGEGGPEERARASRIPYVRISENVALGQSLESAQESLMMSPGHRANILDPEFTHAGTGVVFADGPAGKEAYITQDFIKAVEWKDPNIAASEVRDLVNREREKRGLPALAADKKLDSIAREQSLAMLKKGRLSPSGALDRIKREGLQYKHIQVEVFQTVNLDEVKEGGIGAMMAKNAGVAAIQDKEGTYWITMIFLEPQALER